MNLSAWRKAYIEHLAQLYPAGEAEALFFRALQYALGIDRLHYTLQREYEPDAPQAESLRRICHDLRQGRPLQYITGEQWFYSRCFAVDARVLIPRGETEELVARILSENGPEASRVLDIGTGSGAIAVTLALERPQWEVAGWDISEEALQVAGGNARRLGARVDFRRADILDPQVGENAPGPYDIVVSNPPYVLQSEREQMHVNVWRHEPSTALFVPDDDPLVFYRAIARFARGSLAAGGRLYFEINRAFGRQTAELLAREGYRAIEVWNDINGRQRMVRAQT